MSRIQAKDPLKRRHDSGSGDASTVTGNVYNSPTRSDNSFASMKVRDVCFVCTKTRALDGDHRLTTIKSESRLTVIHEKAKELNHERILSKIMRHGETCIDLTAHGYKYHKRCMTSFLNTYVPNQKGTAYDAAFEMLLGVISDSLFEQLKVLSLNTLNFTYINYLKLAGVAVEAAEQYRTDNLRIRLRKRFGDELLFLSDRGRGGMTNICSRKVTLQRLIAQTGMNDDGEMIGVDIINIEGETSFNQAKLIRNAIKKKVNTLRGLNGEMKISHEEAMSRIPVDLFNHVAWILTEAGPELNVNNRCVKLEESDIELVLNVCQTLMAAMVKIPLPKQVATGIYLLKKTRNKGVITIMNRLGNSIGYQDTQRYVTAMAAEVIENEKKNGMFIPANIIPGSFIQGVVDNYNVHPGTGESANMDATVVLLLQYGNTSALHPNVPLKKSRKATIECTDPYIPNNAYLTLKDRREARSIKAIHIPDNDKPSNLVDDSVVWMLMRLDALRNHDGKTDITWRKYFTTATASNVGNMTNIAYGPFYPESPTDPAVVEKSLEYLMSITDYVGQERTVVTVDQAIYDIVKGFQSKSSVKYQNLVCRLGGFHIACNMFGCVGAFMKGSGFEEVLVKSEVCNEGTANKVINGKDYYMMVALHSTVAEAMFQLKWEAFTEYMIAEDKVLEVPSFNSLRGAIDRADTEVMLCEGKRVLSWLETLEAEWGEFEDSLGDTGLFWSGYIDMILLLFRYIQAERSANWSEHLSSTEEMLNYMTVAGHTKYMACIPQYTADMRKLPETAPKVHEEFMKGNFVVRRAEGQFNGIWTDLSIEQTYNNDGKTHLLNGVQADDICREKYIKALPMVLTVVAAFEGMMHINSPNQPSTKRDVKVDVVQRLKGTIINDLTDPFSSDTSSDLINIATGQKLAKSDLANIRTIGAESVNDVRLNNSATIKKPKILTFQIKKRRKTQTSVDKSRKAETSVTRSLLFTKTLSEEKKEDAFSYEWTPYPTSLFAPTKNDPNKIVMRKGNKADFMIPLYEKVNEEWSLQQTIPEEDSKTAYLIDLMGLVQRYRTYGCSTWCQLKKKLIAKILQYNGNNDNDNIIHVVADRYDLAATQSLKADERNRRTDGNVNLAAREFIPRDGAVIPNWNEFMSRPENKRHLIGYLSDGLKMEKNLPENLTLILAGMNCGDPGRAEIVSLRGDVVEIQSLRSDSQEEADTRIFAHLAYSTQKLGYTRALIIANDTDITILAMYYITQLKGLKSLWLQAGDKYLCIDGLVECLALATSSDKLSLCKTILAVYVLSGCDTVSYSFGRSKKGAAKCALRMIGKIPNLANFTFPEDNSPPTPAVMADAVTYYSSLYGRPTFKSIDRLRAHLFAVTQYDLRAMPCTEDAFTQHVLRALLTLGIYKQAHVPNMVIPSITEYGRRIENGVLVPVMTTKPARPVFTKRIFCKCGGVLKCMDNCQCKKAGVSCTAGCPCADGSCGRDTELEDQC